MYFLDRLALAVQRHEGWYPNSLSFRQNNPGNLRFQKYHATYYGAKEGEHKFAKFPSYKLGLKALKDDLRAKICGYSQHIDYSSNPAFLDMMKVYAPKEDNNNPNSYTQSLIRQLSEYSLCESTPLSYMAKLVNLSPVEPINLNKRNRTRQTVKSTQRGIKRAINRGLILTANTMMRLENRLINS